MLRKSKKIIAAILVVIMAFNCSFPVMAFEEATDGSRGVLAPTFLEITAPSAYMKVGSSMQLESVVLPRNLSLSYNWYSTNTSIATVSSSGRVTAKKHGTVTIGLTVSSTGPLGGSLTDTITIYIYNTLGIAAGEAYYIMNASSQRLLSVETTSDANNTNVYTRSRSSNVNMSEWVVLTHGNDGFKLKSNYSSSGKCLDVTGTNVDIYTDNGESYLKFTIERVESGDYDGLYTIKDNNGRYVTQNSNYNVYVTTTLSEASYWSFMATEKRYADYFGIKYSITENNVTKPFDTYVNSEKFEFVFGNMGYGTESHENSTATVAYSNCLSLRDDIFILVDHGDSGVVYFCDKYGAYTGAIIAKTSLKNETTMGSDIKSISEMSTNALSQARMILYLGCKTGCDSAVMASSSTCNLIDETYAKGAHYVLGVTEVVYVPTLNSWLGHFLDALSSGENIEDAIVTANFCLGPFDYPEYDSFGNEISTTQNDGLQIYDRGDTLQYLNIS